MGQCELALCLAQANNGVITSKMADDHGIKRFVLSYLVSKSKLVKSNVGVYTLPDVFDDDYFNAQNRFSAGVFSGMSALYIWNLTDALPGELTMTFPVTYNCTGPKNAGILCYSSKRYNLGIVTVKSKMGNELRCYNPERTLCDIVKKSKHFDTRITIDAFKDYVKLKDKNIPMLMDYAEKMNVKKQIERYLEVLL